jgi:hypothetical protein
VNQWLLWVGLAGAVTWLVLRHSAHLFEIAPFLLVLACPVMHLFGHGHGGHGRHGGRDGDERDGGRPRPGAGGDSA